MRRSDLCRIVRHRLALVAILIGLSLPVQLFAALGGDATTVQADQAHFQATLHAVRADTYTVQELHSADGTIVREYVSPQGKVFGVAWQAPWPPDMEQLLGTYYEQYSQARQSTTAARGGRRPLKIEQNDLVVHIAGHPRAFSGQAYVPSMVPQGVKAEDIR
jgi:hypothetical protein